MFEEYHTLEVVVDTDGPHAYVGRLVGELPQLLILGDVAIYDRREAHTAYELYLIEAKQNGYPASRQELRLNLARVVAMSRLSDVTVP